MDAARVGREIETGKRMQRTQPNGSARGDGTESDIDTMFDEILGGFGESNLALDDPRTRRGHHADDSIVSLISSYEGDTGDPPRSRPTGLANTYSSHRPASRPGERLRPLPMIPGAPTPRTFTEPAPPPPLPSTISMPAPEPYQHPSLPEQSGPATMYTQGRPHVPLGPANTLLGTRRHLPSHPETFGMPPGIGPGRRATGDTKRPHTADSDTLSSPMLALPMSPRLSQPTPGPHRIPTVHVGAPEEYQPNYSPLAPPPGAMPPSIPGSNNNSISSPSIYRSPSPQPGYEAYSPGAPYPSNSSKNTYTVNAHPPRTTSHTSNADYYSTDTLSPTFVLGRSTSTTSSTAGGENTISRAPSLAAGSDTSFFSRPIDRANSKSSNWSTPSNIYPGGNNYPASIVSYETGTNNDVGGYLDLPGTSSPVSGPSYRQDQHYLEERIATAKGRLELHEDDPDDYDYSDEDETLFVNLALLSHLAVKLRDKVPRGTHVKGSIPYTHAFTGKDIVVRI